MYRVSLRAWHGWRWWAVLLILLLLLLGLISRMVYLTVWHRPFLLRQSKARVLRKVAIPAHRGMILDRHGQPLAISTPLLSVWVNPKQFAPSSHQWAQLARLLHRGPAQLKQKVALHKKQFFLYLKRRVSPDVAASVKKLHIRGVFFQREYRRFYTHGAMTAHVLGSTNVDDQGQEGIELWFDQWLRGVPGRQWVIKDRHGHVVEHLKLVRPPHQGHNLMLALDARLQYLAYRELSLAMHRVHAKSGTVVVLDAYTGEVLAMVNLPSFNPNQPRHGQGEAGRYRNRALTDLYEPGSTIKTLSLASALESGRFSASSVINTHPGLWRVGGHAIIDEHVDHGRITLTQVLQKSSNIGVAKVTLAFPADRLVRYLSLFGLGQKATRGFPGEAKGMLPLHKQWRPFELAALSFGYGLAVTLLQLVNAYATIADGGVRHSVYFLRRDQPAQGERVLKQAVAAQLVTMLESVVQPGGTGRRAKVPGYRVAGKTETAYIAGKKGYDAHRYIASFVGMGPLPHPRFIVGVVIHEPEVAHHYGGLVAAPVFSKVMEGILRLYGMTPDMSQRG